MIVGMEFKKLLGVILVIILSVFGLMLTVSYAWYSYENASTKFDVVTANDDVEVTFQKGEYIYTDVAIPVKEEEVDLYSDKYDFNIKVKSKDISSELVAKVSLVNIVIDDELKKVDEVLGDSPFRVEFVYQGGKIGDTISGKSFNSDTIEIGDVVLSSSLDNQFELRIYLLDNNGDQSRLMNKEFRAKIDINVISRSSISLVDFKDSDVYVSSITIDGVASSSLPVNGYYDMNASCEKGSHVSWDAVNKVLIYGDKSYIGDRCDFSFVRSNTVRYLKDVDIGSYVNYVGNSGCNGKFCNGFNANYVDDNNMGNCGNGYSFVANGFRVGYIKDGSAYLVSAGSPECSSDNSVSALDKIALRYCNARYAYGGICNADSVWSIKKSDIDSILDGKSYYYNSLIDNGSYYYYIDDDKVSFWNPSIRNFSSDGDNVSYGVRPIIRMKDDVLVVGGSGTYKDPFIIQE